MIKILENFSDISEILNRSAGNFADQLDSVKQIISDVRQNGDQALIRLTQQFDKADITDNMMFTEAEIQEAYNIVSDETLSALKKAKNNILNYALRQIQPDGELIDGVGFIIRPVSRAGVYVPGGTAAYPSSVLMCALPAVAAGVDEVVMTTPVGRGVNPLVLVAADLCGIKKIYKLGGAQAIAALAYGTDTVERVDVISGPGNIYVALAKREVFGDVGIDMVAGPSEILIIADRTANPRFLAADLLSQAEHDPLAGAILLTTDKLLARAVARELTNQLSKLPRNKIATASIRDYGAIVVTKTLDQAFEISNRYAPEHLELCIDNPKEHLDKIKNAGAVFLGHYTPESTGDYYAGTNHVLPTNGTARFFSSLSPNHYLKKISIVEYDKERLYAAKDDIIKLAEAEELTAHANAVRIRFK